MNPWHTTTERTEGLIITVFLATLGCTSVVPRIDPDVNPAMTDEEVFALNLGRRDYIAKCSGCHSLYSPARGNPAYWDHWVDAMTERSNLDPTQKKSIKSYLIVAASQLREQ